MQKVLKLIFLAIAFPFILWRTILKLSFGLRENLTIDIREKAISEIQQANNYLITLSSSAIFLTFFILQRLDRSVFYKEFLIISWIGFTLCILIGVIIVIATYVLKLSDLVAKDKGKNLKEAEDANERRNCLKGLLDSVREIEKFVKGLFALLFSQPIIFFLSIVSLLSFAIGNILMKR